MSPFENEELLDRLPLSSRMSSIETSLIMSSISSWKCSSDLVTSRGAVSSLLADGSWLIDRERNVFLDLVLRRISSRSCSL